MNNESSNFFKIITTASSTSTSANINAPNTSINSGATPATQYSSISSPLSLLSSSSQSYSTSAQFDVTVNAIAAVVNASNNLPVTTPPNAAAVVAVAVSSLAAAIIPDTPIVSIAGSTLSEITTTTTSTKTTPTPIPTSKETDNSKSNSSNTNPNNNKNLNKDVQNKTSSSPAVNPSSSSYSTTRASVKGSASMSVANSSTAGALTNASITAANVGAVEIKNNTNSIKQIKDNSTGISAKGSSTSCDTAAVTKSDSLPTATESKSITAANSSSQPIAANANVSGNKTDDSHVTSNHTKSKDAVSESWEESRLKDWDDSKLKELLDEAYSYKNPRDKENKSKTFLKLLEKAENEDQSYPFCVTSRGTRNLSNSITSNSYHHYQQNSHYHSHSHNNNRSHHHHHKQGGSLQDLFEIGLHESPLDCDQTFGIGIIGNQRTRRQNHNSRQKKYSSSVSSRQREGGSLPSNVNVTHQLSIGGSGGVVNDISLLQQDANTNKSSKKEQRRTAAAVASTATVATKAATSTATVCADVKENFANTIVGGETVATNKTTTTTTTHPTYTASGGDFIIDMGEPMMDIQQQQKILQCKGQDAATQGQPFYERLANNDKRIPRANMIGSTKATYFAPTTSHCYVDETVRFNALERNGNSNSGPTQPSIDAKFLPLDENYKSCKSVLGSDGDNHPEMLSKTKANTIYTKMSTPASGSAILTGTTTNNIATLTQRQLDENGNALSEIYQNSSGSVVGTAATIQINAVSPANANATAAALLNSCGGNVSTSATVTISPHTASTTVSTSATVTTTFTSGPSQAKAKAKKKSQQERNTKTVDVESVAGYRGKDPVEELVKYIESSGEDKQNVSKSSGDKKKERKKDKEKHQKLKKSNSLEELRSGAKMEVHELKRTAATTESNAVLVRQKSGGGGGKKNNSSSTADINKNLDGGNNNSSSSSSKTTPNPRKSERRSWANEDFKYSEDQQNVNLLNDVKPTVTAANSTKEKKNKIGASLIVTSKEEKEIKDKTNERNERNLANNITSLSTMQTDKFEKLEKSEKAEKSEKSEKSEKTDKSEKSEKIENKLEKRKKQTDIPSNAVTVVDILAIESVLPETAEFHVVTKKKKPKKQKIINNLEETTVTFNRTHNFTMQKTSTFNQQQQQMTVRYKYYHHDNASTNNNNNNNITGNSINSTNANSQLNQQPNSQQQQHQQQSQSQHHQHGNNNYIQNQNTSSDGYNITTTTAKGSDKSRRKSTSSMPPSDKSDSSDLDSVHSLPIEATTKAAGQANNMSANNSHKTKVQTRSSKPMKNNNALIGKALPPPAPISYADIARTNKEIADAAANIGSASVILINTNEISLESRNTDVPLTSNENSSCDDKLLPSGGNNSSTTPTATTTNLNAANLKVHKIKKSQIKQDFPELSGGTSAITSTISDDHKLSSSTNNNHKTITYSQSLTAVQNLNSHQNSVSGSSTAANESFHHAPLIEHNAKVSAPAEQQKNLTVHQQAYIAPPPPLQYAPQQILHKSKSVETDNIIASTSPSVASTSTSSSSSSSSSVAAVNAGSYNVNSNNLDQQYPALEKTFKRHSSVNVTALAAPNITTAATAATTTANNSQQTPFNFAAAAKQQIVNNNNNNNSTEQYNINLNKTSNLTTSNTHNSNSDNTHQVALLTATKKSKEKSPLLTAQPIATENVQHVTTAMAVTPPSVQTNPRKTKKERQQLQLQQPIVDVNQAKQNQNNTITQKKPLKNHLKTSNSLPLGLNSSSNATITTTGSSSLQNRPAVIILNDYRNSGSCAADNQFTFGDFNEEELKLFDDDHNTSVAAVNDELRLSVNTIDANLSPSQEHEKLQRSNKSSEANPTSPCNAYLNDSGTSCNNDVVNNTNSEILSSSSIDTSSPNSSFNNCTGGILHQPAHNYNSNNNRSSDSGIYTDKTKSSQSDVCKSTSSCPSGSTTFGKQKEQQHQHQHQPTPNQKEENDRLNTFLSKNKCTSNHASMDNLAQAPPPQQLETCNDIETAIIAAARAAAKQQQPNQQQQPQQQYKNSNNSSNSSSFSSSSLTSSTSASSATTAYQQHSSHSNNSNKYGRGPANHHHMSSYHQSASNQQLHQQQYDEDDYINNEDDHDDTFSNNTPRSRSPSRPRRISIAGGTVANKEFDIHFIPPTTMPTAFTTQQHNDIIVDFIGSAWEEVSNSKVTKVYDGQ